MAGELRKIIVSPEINGPEPFVGYGGFCGWPRICRLNNGDLYVVFSAGYAHASWVNPRPDVPPEYGPYMNRMLECGEHWFAPTGGHVMWTRSSDEGATWTRPRDLCVLPDAYGAGDIMQCSDGTMFAAALIQRSHFWARVGAPTDPVEFLRYMAAHFPEEIAVFRSEDNGESWREVGRTSGPFLTRLEHPNAIVESRDGSLLMLLDGHAMPAGKDWPWSESGRWVMAVVRSTDRGKTWETWSIFGDPERDMEEGHLAYLPDGRVGTASRPASLWTTSPDNGKTWAKPAPIFDLSGIEKPNSMKKGDLLVTPDGTAVLLTCGPPGAKGQLLYSRDSGSTWIKPAPDRGFAVDRFAYYPSGCVMEDGSIFMVGDHQGFPNRYGPYGSETVATRFRILSPGEGEGFEILPIAGELHEVTLAPREAAYLADGRLEEKNE